MAETSGKERNAPRGINRESKGPRAPSKRSVLKAKRELAKLREIARSPALQDDELAAAVHDLAAVLSYRIEKKAAFLKEGFSQAILGECWETSGETFDKDNPKSPVSVKRNGRFVRSSTYGEVLAEKMDSCG